MSKKLKKSLSIMMASSILFGCGGGDGDGKSNNELKETKISGGVYNLANTKVFFDLNQNMKHDHNEPTATTNEKGEYELTIPNSLGACIETTPILANVNPSSIYVSNGENPVGSYVMARSPDYIESNLEFTLKDKNITYLTTMNWMTAPEPFSITGDFKICGSIISGDHYFKQIEHVAKNKKTIENELSVSQKEINSLDYINSYLKNLSDEIELGFISNYQKIKANKVGFLLRENIKGRYWESYSQNSNNMKFTLEKKEHQIAGETFDYNLGVISYRESREFDSSKTIKEYDGSKDIMDIFLGHIWNDGNCYDTEVAVGYTIYEDANTNSQKYHYITNGISNNKTDDDCITSKNTELKFTEDTDFRKESIIKENYEGNGFEESVVFLSQSNIDYAHLKYEPAEDGSPEGSTGAALYAYCSFNFLDENSCLENGAGKESGNIKKDLKIEKLSDVNDSRVVITIEKGSDYEVITLRENGELD